MTAIGVVWRRLAAWNEARQAARRRTERFRGRSAASLGEPPDRSPPDPAADRPLLLLLGLALVIALAAGTQYVAWRFRFHPNLGSPLAVLALRTAYRLRAACVLALVGALGCMLLGPLRPVVGALALLAGLAALGSLARLYAPYQVFFWYAAYGTAPAAPAAQAVFRGAWVVMLVTAGVLVTAVLGSWRSRQRRAPSDSHGSARWGRGEPLRGERGLLLGRDGRRLLRLAGEGHVLTVAPTRAGKGVSAVIPNLLDHPGSVLVTDPKGENYAVTAGCRREGLRQEVHAFDPFGVVKGAAQFNPVGLIDSEKDDAVDDARLLAEMLVLPGGRERWAGEERFWEEEARGLLTGLILHVAASPDPAHRTLTRMRELLTLEPGLFGNLLYDMGHSEAAGGLVKRTAARLLQKADKERSGVISTAQSHTHFLDSPCMKRVLGPSNVDLTTLKRGLVSVYLVLPTDRINTYARWLRLMIASALLAMARTPGQPEERVLVLLDEFAHLGPIDPVQRDIGLAGAYGVRFWLVVQGLSQLRSVYPDTWPTFLANVDALQAFGVNDWDTADYLSRLTGEATIQVEGENKSEGLSRGRYAQRQLGSGRTWTETGRRLLLPDEVRRLPKEEELLFVKGEEPLLVARLNYLRDGEFVCHAEPNPLYCPVA